MQIFPPGFWPTVALIGMVVFCVFGVDLLMGAKLMLTIGRVVNKKIEIDRIIMDALSGLKKASDKEYDLDHSLMHGWGRFVMSGLLFFGAALILINLLPRIH